MYKNSTFERDHLAKAPLKSTKLALPYHPTLDPYHYYFSSVYPIFYRFFKFV